LLSRWIERGTDVGKKWRMTALMADDLAAVHPHLRMIVDRAKVQNCAPAIRNKVKIPLVPAHPVKTAVADAARL
jgi:hypothetical protein